MSRDIKTVGLVIAGVIIAGIILKFGEDLPLLEQAHEGLGG